MRLPRLLTRVATLAALALASGGVLAQSITFFERQNFSGRRFSPEGVAANFDRAGFNDRAESIMVRRGTWQVCTDAGFRGSCVTLRPGSYPNLWSMGLANRVSSARPFGAGMPPPPPPLPGPGPVPPWRPPPQDGSSAVTLFDGFGLSGSASAWISTFRTWTARIGTTARIR